MEIGYSLMFLKQKSKNCTASPSPLATHCLNCERALNEMLFCPECGQENISRSVPVRILMHDVLEEFFKWDGRLFGTLSALLLKPGRLSTEYNAGRRVRYLSPFKMYFVVSTLFFFVLSLYPIAETVAKSAQTGEQELAKATDKGEGSIRVNGQDINTKERGKLQEKYEKEQETSKNPDKGFEYQMKRAIFKVADAPGEYVAHLIDTLAKSVIFLLPIYATYLALLYVRHKRYYIEHLVFAAHTFTFLFLLAATIALLLRVWEGAALLLGIYPLYELNALRTMYGQGWGKTLLKQLILSSLYGTTLVFVFGIVALVAMFV